MNTTETAKAATTIRVVDLVAQSREMFGSVEHAEKAIGRKLPERDCRFEVFGPNGEHVTFPTGATADDVLPYLEREGWL